jgi:hypothetical protein
VPNSTLERWLTRYAAGVSCSTTRPAILWEVTGSRIEEGRTMMKRWSLISLALVAAFALPAVLHADPQISIRLFDSNRNARHYHTYDDNEDRQYRQYLTERHRRYIAFQAQNKRQQAQYWQYRHRTGGAFVNERFER